MSPKELCDTSCASTKAAVSTNTCCKHSPGPFVVSNGIAACGTVLKALTAKTCHFLMFLCCLRVMSRKCRTCVTSAWLFLVKCQDMFELVRTTLCAILASTVMLQCLSHATSIHKHRKHHKHRFSSFWRHRGDIHSRRPYSDSRLGVLFRGREPGPNGAVPLNTISARSSGPSPN